MADEPGPCPHCGGQSNGTIMYSCPAQTVCKDCGQRWEFGAGIQVLTEEEARAKRPGMYPPLKPSGPRRP